jgi:hypothetical protein
MGKCFGTFPIVGLIVLLGSQGVLGTQPRMPTIDFDMSLNFSPEPELGTEFTLVFTFTPREEIPHRNELNDEAEIMFGSGVELVSGQPHWEGRFEKNKTETIEIVLRLMEPGWYLFSGSVSCCQIDPRFIGEDPELERRTGMKSFGKVFEYHNGVNRQFRIGEPDDAMEIWAFDLKTGESKKTRLHPPTPIQFDPRLRPAPSDTDKNLKGQDSLPAEEKEYGFPIQKANETVDSVQVIYAGNVSFRKGDSMILFLFDQDTAKVVRAVWHCEPESSCQIEILPNHKVRIMSCREDANYVIVGTCDGIQHRIRVATTP